MVDVLGLRVVHEVVDPELKSVIFYLRVDAEYFSEDLADLHMECLFEPFHDEDEGSHQ